MAASSDKVPVPNFAFVLGSNFSASFCVILGGSSYILLSCSTAASNTCLSVYVGFSLLVLSYKAIEALMYASCSIGSCPSTFDLNKPSNVCLAFIVVGFSIWALTSPMVCCLPVAVPSKSYMPIPALVASSGGDNLFKVRS